MYTIRTTHTGRETGRQTRNGVNESEKGRMNVRAREREREVLHESIRADATFADAGVDRAKSIALCARIKNFFGTVRHLYDASLYT